jgi:hypothetical protein
MLNRAFLALPLLLLASTCGFPSRAETCPNGPCKVITLTQQEEQALTGPNMVLDAAEFARRMDLGQVVAYFRKKIAEAPPGEAPKQEPKKE